MSSIIEGYNYDIFVSYRQKDNKHDGWVSEFVDNLKGELEATFKEEINVYFDINSHDGLLETHDVDASLKEKLKCLVFIPIISRTYCDPKSFAWEHEFISFLEKASSDQFGLKVRLPNGNVTNRVLPVRIHDLDVDDLKLCESVLGGVLRGVEFIYKSPGVNRPLRAKEDKPHENLNNTIYRDQINKVANAIDEIIRSLKKIQIPEGNENKQKQELSDLIKSREKRKIVKSEIGKPGKEKIPRLKKIPGIKKKGTLIAVISALLITICIWYLWPFLFKPKIISREFESSVAVLIFEDISELQGFENFAAGATTDLISRLARIQNLKVVPINESIKYKQLQNSTKAICRDFDVKMVLQGSVKAESGNVTLTAELVDGEKDIVLYQQSKIGKLENILVLQDEMVSEIARAINNKYSSFQIQKQVRIRPTKNFKAYELFLKGIAELTKWTFESLKGSIDYFGRALAIDQNFIEAYSNSALANLLITYFYEYDKYRMDAIKKDARKTLSFEDDNEIALMSMEGYYIMKLNSGQRLGVLEYRDMISKLKSLIRKNPSSPMGLFGLAEYYRFLKKDLFKASEYLKMALTQCEIILQSDPSNGIILGIAAQSAGLLGQIEFKTGKFLEAIKHTEYSIKLVPGIARTYHQLSNFYFDTDQPQKARAVLDQAILNVTNVDDIGLIGILQGRYSMVEGNYHEAEKYWADAMTYLGDPIRPLYDYALLYRYVMLCKLGNSTVGDTLLLRRLKTPGINSWPEPIINFLTGNMKEEELIKLARRDWQKCEAYYFLGEKNLISGNLNEAKKYFTESVNTGVTNYIEYDLANAELSRAFSD